MRTGLNIDDSEHKKRADRKAILLLLASTEKYETSSFSNYQARFLSGEDGGTEADLDASLDDDWAKEEAQDAEDFYFAS